MYFVVPTFADRSGVPFVCTSVSTFKSSHIFSQNKYRFYPSIDLVVTQNIKLTEKYSAAHFQPIVALDLLDRHPVDM
jgi:hypothetical protein